MAVLMPTTVLRTSFNGTVMMVCGTGAREYIHDLIIGNDYIGISA